MNEQSGFLIGIGSNIKPQTNLIAIIEHLFSNFQQISISQVLQLPPIGMNSDNQFLNLVAFIETNVSQQQLKTLCNDIETTLGRDRHDPERKYKDRVADLDILAVATFPTDRFRPAHSITDEYFLYPLIDQLIAYLCRQPQPSLTQGIPLQLGKLRFGQAATTIYRNTDTSDKGIVQQTLDR